MRLGGMELAIIIALALLIFGPSQLPKLGRSLGETVKALKGVKKEINDIQDDGME